MKTIDVEVRRSFICTVQVQVADDLNDEDAAEAAIDEVEKESFVLPPHDEWDGMKDWIFTVYDDDGEIISERDS